MIAAGQAPGPAAATVPEQRFASLHGNALPPIGYVDFCRREPGACQARGEPQARPRLSARQWDMAYRLNAYVNAAVAPASDQDIYGEPEHWTYPGRFGDCEDYVLLKQRYLEALGIPRSALLITVVLDDHKYGHAVLTLATSEGDFVLDNRREGIRLWSDLDYTYLKRQSARDPKAWVSLTGEDPPPAAAVASRTNSSP